MTTWSHTSSDSDPSHPNWVKSSISNVENSYSLDFDNTDDYVDFGDVAIFEFTYDDNYTVSAWVNPSAFTDSSMIASKSRASGTYKGWYLNIGTTAKLDFSLYSTVSINRWKILSSSTLSADTWYHVLATHSYSDSTHTGTIYVNGVEGHTTSLDTLTTQDTTDPSTFFNIGARANTNALFNGKIDEVAIWDVALSASDALALYNNGTPSDLTNSGSYDTDRTGDLIGYWRFLEGTGTSVADSSTNSNAGTITSGEGDEWVTEIPEALITWNTLYGGVWNLGSLVAWEDLDQYNWEDWN